MRHKKKGEKKQQMVSNGDKTFHSRKVNKKGKIGAIKEEEEQHLGQVVDGESEEENHGAVEKQFAQTNQQTSSLQTRLYEQTATREKGTCVNNTFTLAVKSVKVTFSLQCT